MSDDRTRRRVLSPRGALLGMVVLGLLFTSVYPLRRYVAVKHEITALRQEQVALEKQKAELEAQKELLKTDEEIERIAREELGMVRPGEVQFVIPKRAEPPVTTPPVIDPAAPAPTKGPSLLSRWWGAVRTAVRSLR